MKALLIASLTALAVLSSAQSADAPHVLYSSGTIFDVGYEFEMGQPTVGIDAKGAKYVSTRGCVKITASQSSQTLRLAANAINGPGPFNPIKWQVHRCPKGGGGGGAGGILSFLLTGITALELPALDAASIPRSIPFSDAKLSMRFGATHPNRSQLMDAFRTFQL